MVRYSAHFFGVIVIIKITVETYINVCVLHNNILC